ncbi:acetate--CoA ligase family protein [Halorarum salinum]|uniref:acetate--CoA ligase (ADP-forming) n=1 Tax=Halorarum salinum TaxID=2743089 RepID=A0A7D5LE14_9EURY|nr:acetate--CoA ligase family protein [Halobaculum salinum]QLG64167.1 acetate--CoA ligase family protein [Halobaculum salinum]
MSESDDPVAAARADGRTTLTEAEAKALLANAGVATTEFAVADDPAAAADAAADIGFPVVLKVSSPSVAHKSEWADGAGVALGLADRDAVETAAERVFDAADAEGIDAEVLVEEARDVDAGTEVIVGGLRDPSFGPVVLTGLGGVFTEVYEDTSHRLAPLDRGEAREAIEELTAAKLLAGYRGGPAADVDALADVVCAVGDLLVEREGIAEVDVNPVLAGAGGAVALDALVLLEDGER